MQDESNTPQEEEEVEGHIRARGPEAEPGRRIGHQEEDDDEVEGHLRPRHSPEEPGRRF